MTARMRRVAAGRLLCTVVAAAGCTAPREAPPTARNVVLIVIDTLRADALEPYAGGRGAFTPAFARLAAEGTLYLQAYANADWTKPSMATLLSGVYPQSHRVRSFRAVLDPSLLLLPERLRDAGLSTALFSANPNLSAPFGFTQGFERAESYFAPGSFTTPDATPTPEATRVYDDALRFIGTASAAGRRFFVHVQTMDVHAPYEADAERVRRYHPLPYSGALGESVEWQEQRAIDRGDLAVAPADLAWIRALYLAQVERHDEAMGRFIDALAAMQVLDDTLVIVTADHGESLGEGGVMGHGRTLRETTLRVPLVLRFAPLFGAGRTVGDITELVDLAPTIIAATGAPNAESLDGRSLLAPKATCAAYAESNGIVGGPWATRRVRFGSHALVRDLTHGGAVLFDLEHDPEERRDVCTTQGEVCRRGKALLDAHLAAAREPTRQGDGPELSEDLKRQLEALGYADVSSPAAR